MKKYTKEIDFIKEQRTGFSYLEALAREGAPDSRFEPFEYFIQEGHPLYAMMNSLLSRLDTGITRLGEEEIPVENIQIPDSAKNIISSYIKEGYSLNMHNPRSPDKIIFFKKGGSLKAKKIITYHNVGYAHNSVNCSIRAIDYFAGLLNLAANILAITKYFAHFAQNI